MTVTLVGELNPYGQDPFFALYHLPERASGDRLRRILGLHPNSYLDLARLNLCTGKWSMRSARDRARTLLAGMGSSDCIVLLGRKVATAFDYTGGFFTWEAVGDRAIVSLPHPSGLNLAWNEPTAKERARRLLAERAPLVPWGETDE